MKKLINKVVRRKQPEEAPSRITTDTLAEHRERVLTSGRRFKYPVQYARHKLVINAIIIAIAALILLIGILGQQLYLAQNTSDFLYRVTRVVPVPVASVDGQRVAFSDYLMKYRSSIHYLQEKEQLNLATDNGKRQSDFVKQQAIDDSVADAYASKIAREQNITVSRDELELYLKSQRQSSDGEVSQTTYDAVILDYYGWSPDEYRQAMLSKLLLQKVAFAIDTKAEQTAEKARTALSESTNLKSVAEAINKDETNAHVTFGSMGWVPRVNQDGGLAEAATKLQKGQISPLIRSTAGDGYYFVKLIDSNDNEVNFEYIQIALTAFEAQLNEVKRNNGVRFYITIPEVDSAQPQQ